ncbi:AAA family ATPase [Oribacterium sp.]
MELETENNNDNRKIDLNHLSSGEKQLISLFNYIYLSTVDECMIIIDEPELSLSVEWQESILEDVKKSGKCGSLIAATQSPFIYNNSLKTMARSLDSFLALE